ncbi:MAG: hypothetical protein II970_05075 [Paludibacteraceae bacterium]|nr:hypothetical protein [Paludibacteraceae bacterium]
MKKLLSLSAVFFAALVPLFAETPCFTGYDRLSLNDGVTLGHLYYRYNSCANAIVAPRKSGTYYKQLVIPANAVYVQSTISDQDPLQGKTLLPVIEIDTAALVGATSPSLTFETPSNLRIIRKQGISSMPNIAGTLELPEGLELIETEGVSNIGTETAPLTKLIVPSTIDSLSLSSVLLDRLTVIEFKGATPPRCAVSASLSPFSSTSLSTPAAVTVIVPDGSFDAYSDALGIGSYFDCFPKRLTVSSSAHGSATSDKPRYFAGETAILTVTPDEHCHFVAWEGDDNAAITPIDGTRFSYVMGSSFRTFTAVFAEDTSTGIDTTGTSSDSGSAPAASSARKLLHNGTLLISCPDGTILNASGTAVKSRP